MDNYEYICFFLVSIYEDWTKSMAGSARLVRLACKGQFEAEHDRPE